MRITTLLNFASSATRAASTAECSKMQLFIECLIDIAVRRFR